jgi:type VI secretion system secreted protein VgrG
MQAGLMGAALAAIPLDPDLCEQAAALGYANRFQAIRRSIPWRPAATAQAPAPTALGVQTATVCGPGGSTTPSGADELYTDALGRIQVQFHWPPKFDTNLADFLA